ncbi:sensor histidine kinase [Sulfurospirillum sp. T05]|uniref:histidine kinase n=1 Tax=Sulfurospirillum tamanense TaxID=2813362 RepID=A0ABS2WP64_9BACT|nr:sensor histidine kinase [Sulfurospirillum tamanensis]MBN2963362.1 sensor histidine kinase [Sulfurospirillum tamanensis]
MKPQPLQSNSEIITAAKERRKKILLAMYVMTIGVFFIHNLTDIYRANYTVILVRSIMLLLMLVAFMRLYQKQQYEKASYAILLILGITTVGISVMGKFDDFTLGFILPFILGAFSLFSWQKGLCFSGALLTVLVGILWFNPTLFATSSFLQSETALLNFLFVVILIIAFGFYYETTRVDAYKRLMNLSHKKDLLYNEIHHRVKNNLNIVSSMLAIQAEKEDQRVKEIIHVSKERIEAMAMVHSMLYVSSDIEKVNAQLFIEKLSSTIERTMGLHVKTKFAVSPLELTLNEVMPLGLIVNELLTNSFKYAFEGMANPCVIIALKENNGVVEFLYQDNGKGQEKEEIKGIGLKLVELNVRQLKGTMALSHKKGFGCQICYKRSNHV